MYFSKIIMIMMIMTMMMMMMMMVMIMMMIIMMMISKSQYKNMQNMCLLKQQIKIVKRRSNKCLVWKQKAGQKNIPPFPVCGQPDVGIED